MGGSDSGVVTLSARPDRGSVKDPQGGSRRVEQGCKGHKTGIRLLLLGAPNSGISLYRVFLQDGAVVGQERRGRTGEPRVAPGPWVVARRIQREKKREDINHTPSMLDLHYVEGISQGFPFSFYFLLVPELQVDISITS